MNVIPIEREVAAPHLTAFRSSERVVFYHPVVFIADLEGEMAIATEWMFAHYDCPCCEGLTEH